MMSAMIEVRGKKSMFRIAAIAAALMVFGLAPAAAAEGASSGLAPLPPQPAGVAFPTSEWPTGAPQGADPKKIEPLLARAFADKPDAVFGETRALIVVQGGKIVLERYAPGYTAEMRLFSWSVAKSITQALVGVAVQQGRVDPAAAMGYPGWKADDPKAAMSWRDWLQMVDGQRYLEIDAPGILESDATQKLFGRGRMNTPAYCAALPLIHKPREHWNYNSCGIMLAADALTRTIVPNPTDPTARRAEMSQWMRQSFFEPIGMRSATPEFDPSGTYYGSALIYATARDFARFGLLYLRDGVWNGTRLLPEGWVDFARTPGPAPNTDTYGAGWWLTPQAGDGKPYRALFTDAPRDAFSAQGHQGQVVLVVPSKDLVVVRLGMMHGGRDAWNGLGDWLAELVRIYPDAAPADATPVKAAP